MSDSLVWMSSLQHVVAFHAVVGRSTPCGKFVGEGIDNPARGHVMSREDAERLGARECDRCFGGIPRHRKPRIVPSRDRTGER